MTETKKRGWVKNAAIIFLAVLLVLTFLSSTIMNRSLPEVAVQYVSGGTVTTRIRGNGTVSANEVYEVKLSQSRTVQSVAVRLNDEVEVGDTLMYLTGDFSEELKTAQADLATMEDSYEKALIAAAGADYARQNRDIENARTALAEAQADLAAMDPGSAYAVAEAQAALTEAKTAVTAAQAEVNDAQKAVTAAETEHTKAQTTLTEAQTAYDTALAERDAAKKPTPEDNGLPSSADAAKTLEEAVQAETDANNAVSTAQVNYDAVWLRYGSDYEDLQEEADDKRGASTLEAYMKFLSDQYGEQYAPEKFAITDEDGYPYDGRSPRQRAMYNQHLAYEAVTEAKTALDEKKETAARAAAAVESARSILTQAQEAEALAAEQNKEVLDAKELELAKAQTALDGAKADEKDKQAVLEEAQGVLTEKQEALTDAQTDQTNAETVLADAQAANTDYEAAVEAVRTARTTLEDRIFDLSEQQKADGIAEAQSAIDLRAQKRAIDLKQAEIDELQADSTGMTLTSAVAGKVKSINVTAGAVTTPDAVLIGIEVSDRGYSLSFPVTVEQSKKLRIGDTADVSNYYWGNEITAVLTSIKNDPENPQQSRIASFEITGDVEDGTQLSLSVGQRSAEYDMIVPNSALRSDSNGDFVLVVVARSSPLGNRYTAQRAEVQILAKDDTNAAVSGALVYGDYVITTASSPIEPGMLVRMAENG